MQLKTHRNEPTKKSPVTAQCVPHANQHLKRHSLAQNMLSEADDEDSSSHCFSNNKVMVMTPENSSLRKTTELSDRRMA